MRSSQLCFLGASVRTILVVGVLIWQGMGSVLTAQDATLSVTILIVNEVEACRPKGYLDYEEEAAESRQCKQLGVADVEDLMDRNVHVDKIKIPPQRIPLDHRLLVPLNLYIRKDKPKRTSPKSRLSTVFLFDWGEPQDFKLSFRRISKDPEIRSSQLVTSQMRGEQRWIHHERADSLAPVYNIKWVLTMGDKKLQLRTRGNLSGR